MKLKVPGLKVAVSATTVVAVVGLVGKILFDVSTKDYSDVLQSALTLLGLLGIHLSLPSTPVTPPTVVVSNS